MRALISVSDKTGIVEFAKELVSLGIEIISTGGTYSKLKESGVPAIEISELTGFPECLDGRVKTLHPTVHAGLLAMRSNPSHMKQLADLKIETIDMVVVNLYPFKATILKDKVQRHEAVENIDIGGPTMLRSAAKNYQDVAVVVDPRDYEKVLTELKENKEVSLDTKFYLMQKVFMHTSSYDTMIADYLKKERNDKELPETLTMTFEKVQDMRYGENPHQSAAFYREIGKKKGSIADAIQLNGKELSFNNINDTNGALEALKEFEAPAVVAVKHANPCGVGSASDLLTAWHKAFEADSVSIYGGILALNRPVDMAVAKATKGVFLEVMIAPDFEPDALAYLQERKNLRLLKLPSVGEAMSDQIPVLKPIYGGLLVQGQDNQLMDETQVRAVTKTQPDPVLQADVEFAMKVVKHVRSNAIVLVKDRQTVGIGPGQPNRITSLEIAVKNAGPRAVGAILGSDAYFPFNDCVKAAAAAGVAAIFIFPVAQSDESMDRFCDGKCSYLD